MTLFQTFKRYKLSFIGGSIALAQVFLSTQGYCVTDGDFAPEVAKVDKLITGGYMHLGLMAMCGFGGIICIIEKKLTGALVCAAASLFVFLMKGWITTNFAAVI